MESNGMKKKDFILVIVIIFVAGLFSFLISSWLLGGEKNRQQTAEVVNPITSEFNLPSEKIFNTNAINPTKQIEIGPNTNQQPFENQ
jgi:flagellar basal body-associated protein FliL